MRKVKIGIIGATGRGETLGIQVHQPEAGARVEAACDLNEALLGRARRYGAGIFTTTDHHELLKQDLDAVFVTTPIGCMNR